MPVTSYAASGYLTVAEASEYSSYSQATVRRAIARGDLKDTRIGRTVRIHRDRIDEWMATAPSTADLVAS